MQPLDETLQRAVYAITRKLMPQGFDTSSDAPGTLEDCTAYFKAHGTVCVSNYFGPDVVMGKDTAQQAFAAWHDYCHVTLQASFDRDGERRVNDCMIATLRDWRSNVHDGVRPRCSVAEFKRAAAVLEANNIGRLDYWHSNGKPPYDARLFTEGYLAAREML